MRSWPSQASPGLDVPATPGRKVRTAQVQFAFGQRTLWPPRHDPQASQEPLTIGVIRVGEASPTKAEEPRPAGEVPLGGILLTPLPTSTPEEAWERGEWEGQRWIVED